MLAVDIRKCFEVVDDVAEVLHTLGGIFDEAWRAAAFTLETGVKGDRDVAGVGQCGRVNVARGLLLARADRMRRNDRGVAGVLVEVRREVDVRSDIPIHVGVAECDVLDVGCRGGGHLGASSSG